MNTNIEVLPKRPSGSHTSSGLAALICLCFAAITANASDYMGYVQGVVQIGTRVFIYVGNGWFGTDQCGSGRSALILYADTSTPDGRSYISMALSAKLAGNQVYAGGNGSCYIGNTPNGSASEAASVFWLQ